MYVDIDKLLANMFMLHVHILSSHGQTWMASVETSQTIQPYAINLFIYKPISCTWSQESESEAFFNGYKTLESFRMMKLDLDEMERMTFETYDN